MQRFHAPSRSLRAVTYCAISLAPKSLFVVRTRCHGSRELKGTVVLTAKLIEGGGVWYLGGYNGSPTPECRGSGCTLRSGGDGWQVTVNSVRLASVEQFC